MNPAEIGVVIVTHDTCSEVLDALRSLTDHRGPVVVVDAGSTDGTVDTVRAEHPDVTVLELANVGYGRGVNAGVDRLGPDVEVVVAANADVLLSPEAVARLGEEIMADDRIAMVGPRVRYPDGSHQASARRTPDLATALIHAALGWLRPDNAATRRYHALDLTGPDVDEACDVDWVSGCAFAVRRTDFAAVGGFDPGYRLFVEDVDLCERLRAEGRSIRFEPRVVVTHRVGALDVPQPAAVTPPPCASAGPVPLTSTKGSGASPAPGAVAGHGGMGARHGHRSAPTGRKSEHDGGAAAMSMPTTALIVAGGRGTRLLPLTRDVPKPMLPFCGAPFLAGLARRLAAVGVVRIGLVVGADPRPFLPLVPLLQVHGVEVLMVPEPSPLDTAGGVRAATADLGEPVLVLNGDVLSDLDLAALATYHQTSGAAATIALTRVADTSTFGVCVLEDDRITAFVEKPEPGTLLGHDTINAGAYVLAAGVLARFPQGPLSFEREVFPALLEAGERLTGYVHDGVWTDLGTPERFLAGQRLVLDGAMAWPPLADLEDLGERDGRPTRHGVLVGRDVEVASDARIDAPVVLGDGVSIGSGAAVGPAVVADAGVHIGDRADVTDSMLSRGAIVSQRAHVTGALLAEGARVGAGEERTGIVAGPAADGDDRA